MSLSKKHFELVAKMISQIEDPAERKRAAEFNADCYARMNPSFDRAKFLKACGVD